MHKKVQLLKVVVLSVVVLIITYAYWTLQPNLEVETLPISVTTSRAGDYVEAKMPIIKLTN